MKQSSIPEISSLNLAREMQENQQLVILDVREPVEVDQVRLPDDRVVYAPLSRLAYEGTAALPPASQDPNVRLVVVCHHGVRSARVTGWLISQGWNNVVSLRGGLDVYAQQVDASIGRYF
jgi:rhodanese-related sulfurtransferase